MPDPRTVTICTSIAVAGIVVIFLFQRGGSRNVLGIVAAFFMFFAYGPVFNLVTGADVYVGIDRGTIDEATIGFGIALVAILAADLTVPQRLTFDDLEIRSGKRRYEAVPLVLSALIVYGLVVILYGGPAFMAGTKIEQIAAAGPGHRVYLLLEFSAVALFFVTRRTALMRRLWVINLTVYITYSLLTSERDFLLAVFAVMVVREVLSNRMRSAWIGLGGVGAVIGAASLFAYRASERLDVAGILNQGSILFVDSFIIREVKEGRPYELGDTYRDSILGILPSWLLDIGIVPLNERLVEWYAPGSRSGYGFSLSGEAYLNFGYIGIPVVFFSVALAHRFVINRADRSDVWAYLSIYSTIVWMYALRGDSSQLLKSLFYGLAFFGTMHVLSTRPHGDRLLPQYCTPRRKSLLLTASGLAPPTTPP